MGISRTDRYLHWALAAALIGMFALGLVLDELPRRGIYFPLRDLHINLGLAVLVLGLWRIARRLRDGFPEPFPEHAIWERWLARGLQVTMLGLTVIIPVAGITMALARQVPIELLGMIPLPELTEKQRTLGEIASEVHEEAAEILMWVIGLHVTGALKHHFVDRDRTLDRMLGRA